MTREERVERVRDLLPLDFHRGAEIVVAEQDRSEGPLVEALRKLAVLGNGNMPGNSEGNVIAQHALAAWEALDAKPEPTLLEAAKAVVANVTNHVSFRVGGYDLVALKAAVEREEGKR